MRVLFITGAYPPMHCGVGDYTSWLVDSLQQIPGVVPGVLTSVASAGASRRPTDFFAVMKGWGLASLPAVIGAIRRFRPDVVHLQYPSSFGRVIMPNLLPLVCKALGIVMVQTWHEHPIYSQLLNALPNDTLVVVDAGYPAGYRQPYRFLTRRRKCVTIPIGANLPCVRLESERRSRIRAQFDSGAHRLLAYFGFAIPLKGIEELLRVADPVTDRVVLICLLDGKDPYQAEIRRLCNTEKWRGKCFVTGYLESEEAAAILAAADAAVFPFRQGATPRNGSILAARLQGTLVVTTHARLRGYHAAQHTFYVAPGDEAGMRVALELYAGKRGADEPAVTDWNDVALRHVQLYKSILEAR